MRRRAGVTALTAGIVLVGVLAAAGVTVALGSSARTAERGDFDRAVVGVVNEFEHQLDQFETILNAVHGLHAGQSPTSDSYRVFVAQLSGGVPLANRYPGVMALGIARHDADQVVTFELVEPAGIEFPYRDVVEGSELERGMWRAAELGVPVVVAVDGDLPGTAALIRPLLGQAASATSTPEVNLEHLKGWSVVFIDEQVLLDRAVRRTAMTATVQHRNSAVAGTLSATDPTVADGRDHATLQRTMLVSLADHTWSLTVRPRIGTGSALQRQQHLVVGFAALIIVGLLSWIVHREAVGREAALARVDQATTRLRIREQQYEALAAASPIGIFLSDAAGEILYVNDELSRILDAPSEALLGSALWSRLGYRGPSDGAVLLAELSGGGAVSARPVGSDGTHGQVIELRASMMVDDTNISSGFTGTAVDISEQVASRAALEEREATNRALADRFAHQARHDALTGAPNRLYLADALEAAIAAGVRQSVTLVVLDLDGFKLVNDSLGHAAGDQVLVAVNERLSACVRRDDVVARLGGDEFAVLFGSQEPAAVREHCRRILQAINEPIDIDGVGIQLGASVGIATNTVGDESSEELLRRADLAMYAAKAGGKNRVELFTEEMGAATHRSHTIERELRTALEQGGLDVAYQPIVELSSGHIVALEALARWKHTTLGTIPPGIFIEVAERAGMMVSLGVALRERVFTETAGWCRDLGIDVTVNVSTSELTDDGFSEGLLVALRRHDVPPERVIVEITETDITRIAPSTIHRLIALQRAGLRIAIDDFGQGYSSLARLRDLPVDVLKIDRSFIDGVEEPSRSEFVGMIVTLGRSLGCDLVAEGIESQGQASAVARLGCRFGQGFHLHHPATPGDIAALLEDALVPRSPVP